MNRYVIAGLAAGSCAGFWWAVGNQFFPTSAWGALPLLLGMLPFAAGLLHGYPLLLRFPESRWTRWVGPAAALLLPMLFFFLYEGTDALSFVSGKDDVLSLLFLVVMHAVFAGLVVDTISAPRGQPFDQASLLTGAAAGMIALPLVSTMLPLPLLWLLQALPFFFLGMKPVNPVADEAPAKPAVKVKPGRGMHLPDATPYALPLLTAAGTLSAGLFLRTLSEMPFVSGTAIPMHTGFLLLAIGLGIMAGKKLMHQGTAMMKALLPSAAAAVLLLASWLYADGGYASLYIAYYEGLESSMWTMFFPLLFLHLPAFGIAAALTDAAAGGGRTEPLYSPLNAMLMLCAATAAGLLGLAFLLDTSLWQIVARAMGGLMLLFAVWQLVREFTRGTQSYITAAVAAGAAALAILQPSVGFYGFLNPSQFRVTTDAQTFAGRLTLLQSRDYDDPFHALLWRSTNSLTQSSRLVQSALYRMGHIPMLMGAERARVLVLGLGSAIPLHGVMMHDPKLVDCVEPFGPSIRLAPDTRKNMRPRPWLKNVRFHAERIESFVRRSDSKYDVIISAEPFALPGIPSALLTKSTIERTAALLATNGVYAQWLPVSRVGAEGVRSVAAAMGEVFPYMEMWISGPDPENAMVGILGYVSKPASGVPAPDRLAKFMGNPEIAFHLRQIEINSWTDLAAAWTMDDRNVRSFAGGASSPELFSPLHVNDAGADPARMWTDLRTLIAAGSPAREMRAVVADSVLAEADKRIPERLAILDARVLSLQGNDQEAAKKLGELLRSSPRNTEARHALAGIFLRQAAGFVGEQQYANAFQLLNSAMALAPLNTYLLRLLMISAFQTGDREAAALSIDGIKKLDPLHAGFRDNQGTIRAQQGATNDALTLYENAITLDKSNEEFYCNMASFHFSQQRVWEAVRVLDEARKNAYYPAKAMYLQGLFYAEQGRSDLARESWEAYQRAATPIDPMLAEVEQRLDGLGEQR